MGRRGWGGSPPGDDAEARKRIIDTASRCIERRGPARTAVADVADALGITRRTVYRYFTSAEDLFAAVAQVALGSFIAEIQSLTSDLDAAGQLVEVVAYIIEQLPHKPQLALLLVNDRTHVFSRRMLLPEEIARCRVILEHAHIDWAAMGFDEASMDGLVEFLLRIIQSMVIAPLQPPRSGQDLRAFLRRWMAPALS